MFIANENAMFCFGPSRPPDRQRKAPDTLDAASLPIEQRYGCEAAANWDPAPGHRKPLKTTVVWGESDRMIPPAHGHAFCRGIVGAELIRVPSAGHMVIIEQPEAIVAAIAGRD
jgi:pimeloyl-ACP methyl ester carboxylesterase